MSIQTKTLKRASVSNLEKALMAVLSFVFLVGIMAFSMALFPKTACGAGDDPDAWWPNFRGSDTNMAIVDARTPTSAATSQLKWVAQVGPKFANNFGNPLIVGDSLVVTSGSTLCKIDCATGSITARQKMKTNHGFGLTNPVYAEGMIIMPLSGGTVQAFDAETLEPLWTFQDELYGQANSPITYSDGCVYVGFWNSPTDDANFVCIDIKDDDPTTVQEKTARWTYTSAGGFYYAGALAFENTVLVATSDGINPEGGYFGAPSTGPSKVCSFDKKTGELISTAPTTGSPASCVAFDEDSQRIFLTTKCGILYSIGVDPATGVLSDVKTSTYGNFQTTSTPVVYGGRVYIGLGMGLQNAEMGKLLVADANTLQELFTVDMSGYPQTSFLISTAYAQKTGKVYAYGTYNYPPGGLQMIEVTTNCTSAADARIETLLDPSHIADPLKPEKSLSEYCLTSPICDAEGTIYFKNDSGALFAVKNTTTDKVKRLAGDNRYATMARILDEGYQTNSCTDIILASGENFPDALAASGLSGMMEAPVVLTAQTELSDQAQAQIDRISVAPGDTTIHIMGGPVTISPYIADTLAAQGYHLKRIAGDNREETALAAYEAGKAYGSWCDTALVASGASFADALSIGPFAGALRCPIFLTNGEGQLAKPVQQAISSGAFAQACIVSGDALVPNATEQWLANEANLHTMRWAGSNRYETSAIIARAAVRAGVLTWDKPAVASGANFPDALAGATLCSRNSSVLLLAASDNTTTFENLKANAFKEKNVYLFGGPSSISEELEAEIRNFFL